MTVAGQNVVNYAYDNAGRMASIAQKIGNSTRTYSLTYDSASRRTSLQIPISTKNKFVTTTYGYDTANRLLSMLQQGSSAQIENLLYEYDPNGNRTKSTRNATMPLRTGVDSATYDNANEMLTFKPASATTRNMTYDNNGNLTSVTNNCGVTNYTWNARNQLVGINGFTSACASLTASFKYDAMGRRIEKTINGVTTRYVYDGLDIIQEKNASGAVTANYIRTLNIDEPLTRIKSDGTMRHYVTDALGSVIALTDDTGAVRTTYTYDAFGNVTVSGESSDNPFQYTGRENDGTGLYYYRARYYSPELQRFISEDPIRLAGGSPNYYAYVGNNPVNFVDPLGLSAQGGWSPESDCENKARQWYADCKKAYNTNRQLCVASCNMLFFWNAPARRTCILACQGADIKAMSWCEENYKRMLENCKKKECK